MIGERDGGIDWIFRTLDPDATDWIVDTLAQAGVNITGSRTFRDMAAYYPTSTAPYAAAMREIPKVYFSTSPDRGSTTQALGDAVAHAGRPSDGVGAVRSRNEARRASGELAEEIARLKQEPGSDILARGARFANSLVKLGLVDELRLLVHPVVLGQGLALLCSRPAPN